MLRNTNYLNAIHTGEAFGHRSPSRLLKNTKVYRLFAKLFCCRLSVAIFLLIFAIGQTVDAKSSYANKPTSRYPLGSLMGSSPTVSDLYNPATGHMLLLPDVPIPPPKPDDDATILAIIDSGVLSDHPQLMPLVIAEESFAGSTPRDTIGHGTFVALKAIQVIADPVHHKALRDPNVYPKLLSARVTNDSAEITVESVMAAIRWAIDKGADQVNLSLAFVDDASDFSELCDTIAGFSDVLFLAAAGNFGPDKRVYPAHCPINNILAISEASNGGLTATSGAGHVAAPSSIRLFSRAHYYLDKGVKQAQIGNYAKARELLLVSLNAERSANTLLQVAIVEILQNDLSSASDHLREARSLAPRHSAILSHLGAVKYLQSQYVEAKSLLQEAIQLDGDNEMAQFNFGQTLVALGSFEEALAIFSELKKRNLSYPGLDAAIGRAAIKGGILGRENADE